MNNWKDIWNARTISKTSETLESLLNANGFDNESGFYSTESWLEMVNFFSNTLNINESSLVLEVGCGSGAFLYSLRLISGCEIYGYDYSEVLIKAAEKIVSKNVRVSEAINNPFKQIKFDVVFAHSVFQYFHDLNYAKNVINEMANSLKKGGKIAILDLNDDGYEIDYHTTRSSSYSDPSEYYSKFNNLKHMFYNKFDISKFLKDLGFINLNFYDNPIKSYGNSKFRFNVYATKDF